MRAEWLASCQHTRDSPQSVRLQSVLGSHQQDKHHQHHQHHQQYQHHQHPPHSDKPLTGTAECEIFVPLTWWHLTPGKEGTEEGVTVTLTKVKLELLLNFLSLSLTVTFLTNDAHLSSHLISSVPHLLLFRQTFIILNSISVIFILIQKLPDKFNYF